MSPEVVLLRKLLATLVAVEWSDFLMDCWDMLLQVVLPSKPVLADITLPISSLLFLWLAIFAKSYTGNCNSLHCAVASDGITQSDATVLVLAVKCWRVKFVLFLGSCNLVNRVDVVLESCDALENLEKIGLDGKLMSEALPAFLVMVLLDSNDVKH